MSQNNNGVYFSFLVSENDAIKLNDFGRDVLGLDMENSGCSYESRKHASLFASKTRNEVDYDQIVKDRENTTITVQPVGWKIIKSPNTGKDCLALIINSDELIKHHEEIKKITGLNHAFDSFITHISLHYDVQFTKEDINNLPVPNFDIQLDRLFTKVYENKYNQNMGKQHVVEPGQISKIEVTSTESTSTYGKGFSNLRSITSKMKEIREKLGNDDSSDNKMKPPKIK